MSTRTFLVGILALASARAFAVPDVQVLAVGSNHSFQSTLKSLKFAETDAKRFGQAMETVGLVPSVRSTVITDASVKEFREAFQNLAALDAREGKDSAAARKFIFYFSGHSDDRGLHLKDGLIGKEELHDLLSLISAHTKIAILDSCFSGGITAKGVIDAPEFELPRMEFDEPSGSVYLTASSGRQLAYESDDLGGSVFTHHLLQGLYGEADLNNDGIVTVDELYQYVYKNTKWQSMNYPTQSAQEPEYIAKLQGQGAIVLSFPAKTNSRLAMDKSLKGEITIASLKGIQFFKVVKIDGQEKTIQLPVGSYQLSVRDGSRVGDGHVKVEPAKLAFLGARDVTWREADPGTEAAKGEGMTLAGSEAAAPAGDFNVAAGAHTGFIAGATPGPFVEISYARVLSTGRRWAFLGGGVLNFHRNQATRDDTSKLMPVSTGESLPTPKTAAIPAMRPAVTHVTTDSTSMYATGTLRYLTPWAGSGIRLGTTVGVGQAYHDQKYEFDDSPNLHEGGLVPAGFLGVGADLKLRSGRTVGAFFRMEMMRTDSVSETADQAQARVLALTTTL